MGCWLRPRQREDFLIFKSEYAPFSLWDADFVIEKPEEQVKVVVVHGNNKIKGTLSCLKYVKLSFVFKTLLPLPKTKLLIWFIFRQQVLPDCGHHHNEEEATTSARATRAAARRQTRQRKWLEITGWRCGTLNWNPAIFFPFLPTVGKPHFQPNFPIQLNWLEIPKSL